MISGYSAKSVHLNTIIVFTSQSHYKVNACLLPLCAAHGLAITTIEGMGNLETGLHEVQVNYTAYTQALYLLPLPQLVTTQ